MEDEIRSGIAQNTCDWKNETTAKTYSSKVRLDGPSSGRLRSSPLKSVSKLVSIVAPTTINVLVQGGKGTERTLVAETIHGLSNRRNGAFVRIDCSELSLDRFETEIFGQVPRTTSGDSTSPRTCFERASKGTLFLYDVGAIPQNLQRRLLRILQDRELLKQSGKRAHKIDVRLITASNSDLSTLVKRSSFDEELYNLLKIFEIEVPQKN
ncbi:sigma-54 dependent transcriptional regulator [Granulicella sp. S190]|uniref:sigma-54-dependent transcriptional regulator n=1 Tax=Granulicella sp. S190 TaxID=1747226 RepID=UPI00131E8468|nr:sigma 54-interacting transcriptional regulator [Granulicella sp. S190]